MNITVKHVDAEPHAGRDTLREMVHVSGLDEGSADADVYELADGSGFYLRARIDVYAYTDLVPTGFAYSTSVSEATQRQLFGDPGLEHFESSEAALERARAWLTNVAERWAEAKDLSRLIAAETLAAEEAAKTEWADVLGEDEPKEAIAPPVCPPKPSNAERFWAIATDLLDEYEITKKKSALRLALNAQAVAVRAEKAERSRLADGADWSAPWPAHASRSGVLAGGDGIFSPPAPRPIPPEATEMLDAADAGRRAGDAAVNVGELPVDFDAIARSVERLRLAGQAPDEGLFDLDGKRIAE